MTRFKLLFAALLCGMLATTSAFGQGRRGGQGGPGGGFGGPGGNAFTQYVAALADCNLSPDFTLTADEKTKIQGVRDDFKKAEDDFQTANKDDLDKARQAFRDANGDQDAMATARTNLQAIMAKGPKAEDYVAKVKALLTPDQSDAVDKKVKELAPPARGNRGGPGGAPAAPAPAPAPGN